MMNNDLLTRFHFAAKNRSAPRASFTLERYVDQSAGGDQELKALAAQVNPSAYVAYSRALQNGISIPFGRFLVDRCCNICDVLNTAEYQKAMSNTERKAILSEWVQKFNQLSGSSNDITPRETAVSQIPQDTFEASSASLNSCCDPKKEEQDSVDIAGFYNKYAAKRNNQAEVPLVSTSQAPLTRIGIVVEPPKKSGGGGSNIVVQPPKKTTGGGGARDNANPRADVDSYVDLLKQRKYDSIPRKHLNTVTSRVIELAKTCPENEVDEHRAMYSKLVDLSHTGFDPSDMSNLAEAVKMCAENDVGSLPKRERRALVDFLERGSPEALAEVKAQTGSAFDSLMSKKAKLQALADEDLLTFAPKLAEILEKANPRDDCQCYVIAHNDTPVLRLLLKTQAYPKLNKYMQGLRLKDGTQNSNGPRPMKNIPDATWDPKLSHTKPFVSESGKVQIHASAPFADHISFFRSWLNAHKGNLQIKANSVFLAPTDETLISQDMPEKWGKMTAAQQQKWLLSHQAKSNAGLSGSVKKMASGNNSWITNYKTVYGQNVKALLQTRVVHDEALNASFVPIGRTLTSEH